MQLRAIVLYSNRGKIRTLDFELGRVNVITGQSRTGKSAIIDIVDYCLGRGTFRIFEGVNRDVVSWYAVILRQGETDVFVGKPAPKGNATTQSEACLRIGSNISPLPFSELAVNSNDAGVVHELSGMLRFSPNLTSPGKDHTRQAFKATLEHAKFYLFQEQGEIANRSALFHRQGEQWIPQTIKDTLPYLLGAVPEQRLDLIQEERETRRKLRLLERRHKEVSAIDGPGGSYARRLVDEAKAVGLIPDAMQSTTIEKDREILDQIQNWQPVTSATAGLSDGASQLSLSKRLDTARRGYRQAYDRLTQAKAFVRERDAFGNAAGEQVDRLHAIDILPKSVQSGDCPLCGSAASGLATSLEIGNRIEELEQDLTQVEMQRPRLQGQLEELERRVQEARSEVQGLQQSLQAFVDAEDGFAAEQAYQAKVARVIGRISLYLESARELSTDSGLSQEIEALRAKLEVIAEMLDEDTVEAALASILNRIGTSMTEFAARLELEFAGSPYRLDLKGLTVVADTRDKAIPMVRMGSGENWLGCHLAALLALHKHFIENERPVPGFLIIDQPSQVYFPSTSIYEALDGSQERTGTSDADINAVARMFKLLLSVVQELAPHLQVIVTEHANLPEPWFEEMLVEPPWRNGRALIPAEWLA